MRDLQLVFVYGTLRQGGSNHFRMAGAEFVSGGTVRGRMYRIDWYPGLVLDAAGEGICGEIYRVHSELLAELDRFEGLSAGEVEGCEYRRVLTSVVLESGLSQVAWVWEWRGITDEKQRVFGGDWLELKVADE